MSITGTVGSSGNTTVTTVYVPAQVLGINDLPDYDNTTKHDLGPIIWDNTASTYKTTGQMSISSSEIDLTATTVDLNGNLDVSGTSTLTGNVTAAGTLTVTGNTSVGGDLTVTGSTTFNGGTLTLGDADTDNVVFGGEINSDLIPNTDNTYDLGESGKEWRHLYIDGTAYIDSLTVGTITTTGHWDAQDNDKLKLGNGDDLQIYHNGTDSYITNDQGALKIATEDSGIAVQIGHTTSEVTINDNLTVTGNFTVSGTTTTVDSTTVNIQNAFVFEGATDDDYETTLTTVDPTADRTLSLPNATDTLVGLATTDTLTNKTLTTPVIAEIDSGSSITLDATTDIILDANGGDIYFKDNGTTFATITNSGGNLNLKNGSTSAMTFSGANATVVGDLTISGDDLIMATNTSAYMLVADGTSYNPVAISGDVTIANTGAITLDTVNSNVGSFGTATAIPTFTVNAKGLITAASTVSLSTALPVTADSGTQAAATELLTDTLNFDGTANQITTAIASSSTTDTITIGMPDNVTIDGVLTVDGASTLTGAASLSSTLAVAGATTLNGAVTLGNATGDDIVMTGRLASHLVPKTNDTYDLGTTALRYRDLFLSGETINLGGATISSDGSGEVAISGDGVTLPAGSNVGTDKIAAASEFGVPLYKADFFSEAGGLVTRNSVLTFVAATDVFTAFTFEDGTTLANEVGRELFRF